MAAVDHDAQACEELFGDDMLPSLVGGGGGGKACGAMTSDTSTAAGSERDMSPCVGAMGNRAAVGNSPSAPPRSEVKVVPSAAKAGASAVTLTWSVSPGTAMHTPSGRCGGGGSGGGGGSPGGGDGGEGLGVKVVNRDGDDGVDRRVKAELMEARIAVGDPAGANAGRQLAADDSTDDELEVELEVSKYSLSEKLPQGTHMQSLGRMRGTVNEYCSKLECVTWMSVFKLATAQAFERRLRNLELQIRGKTPVDIELAYRQLRHRLGALLSLHKVVSNWLASRNNDLLPDILAHLEPLQCFLHATDRTLSPDLQILEMTALFWREFLRTSSVAKSMALVDVPVWRKCHAAAVEAKGVPVKGGLAVSDVPEVVAAAADEAEPDAADTKTQSKKRRLDMRNRPMIIDRVRTAGPLDMYAQYVAEALVALVKEWPADILQHEDLLRAAIQEFQEVSDIWTKTSGEDKPESDLPTLLFSACSVVLQCGVQDEVARPDAAAAKTARKHLFSAFRSAHPVAELAKAFTIYDGAKSCMAAAGSHTRATVEDEAASASLHTALDIFEGGLGDGFGDLEVWRRGSDGADERPLVEKMAPHLEAVHAMASCCFSALDRWSLSTLQRNTESMKDTLSNMLLVLKMANFVAVEYAHTAFAAVAQPLLTVVAGGDAGGAGGVGALAVKVEPGTEDGGALGMACATKTEGTTDNATTLQGVTSKFRSDLNVVTKSLAGHLAALAKSVDQFRACYNTLSRRVGDSWAEVWDDVSAVAVAEIVSHNRDEILLLGGYMLSCMELLSQPASVSKDSPPAGQGESYMKLVCDFSKAHKHISENAGLELRELSCLPNDRAASHLSRVALDFCERVGDGLHESRVSTWMAARLQVLQSSVVQMTLVHESVLGQSSLDKMLTLLVVEPALDVLHDAKIVKDTFDIASLDGREHNLAMKELFDFVDAVDLQNFPLGGLAEYDSDAPLPTEQCKFIVRLVCAVNDLVSVAALLHFELLCPLAGGRHVKCSSLVSVCAEAQTALQNRLATLDGMVSDAVALSIEQSGRVVTPSIGLTRSWLMVMAKFAGRCQHTILGEISHLLGEAAKVCRTACPSWESCFDSGAFNETVAQKMTKNKARMVTRAHNDLHSLLASVAAVSGRMGISPRLQEHDCTQEAVAVAMTALRDAKTANVFILGCEILTDARDDEVAASKAKDFLATNRAAHPKLPESFWAALEGIVMTGDFVGKPVVAKDSRHGGTNAHSAREADSTTSATTTKVSLQMLTPKKEEDTTITPTRQTTTTPRAFKKARRA